MAPTFREASLAAFFSRLVVMMAGFANSLLLPLVLDQRSIGQYFLSQLVIAGLATLCQFGFTYYVPSRVTDAVARQDFGRARELAVMVMWLSTALGALVFVIWIAVPWSAMVPDSSERGAWMALMPVVAATGVVAGLTSVVVELLRAVHAIRSAANIVGLTSIFAAGYAGIVLAVGTRATLLGALLAVLVGALFAIAIGLLLLVRQINRWPRSRHRSVHAADVVRESLPNLLSTVVLFGLSNLDMAILAALGNLNEVAQYGLALRFSALLLVPLGIANAAAAPLTVHARSTGDSASLNEIMARVVLSGAGAAALLYVGFAGAGYGFISLWNPHYQETYWLTLLLGAGNVLHACGGAAGIVLMIWGDQKRAFVIVTATGALTTVFCYIGYHLGGPPGLAAAAAFGNALQVGCFVVRVRTRFGIDPSLPGQLRARFTTNARSDPAGPGERCGDG